MGKGKQIKIRINPSENVNDLLDKIAENISIPDEAVVEETNNSFEEPVEEIDDDEYETNSLTEEISFIEFAIINAYLYGASKGKHKEITINSSGVVSNDGKIIFGSTGDFTQPAWYEGNFTDADKELHCIMQTKLYVDNRNELITQLNFTTQTRVSHQRMIDLIKKLKQVAFNNSEFRGKCIKVKLRDGRFRGIEIIDMSKYMDNQLILNDVQKKYIEHFISRVKRGGYARYLLNGEPGTGKTESIREIIKRLIPQVTFIIPDFANTDDLTSIMEACEIFENGVIIMDDIDLYIGSRDNGSYTRLLGQFLSFFDGVKKRKISLLASTNDKGLVDKAAERPGRFNFTLDYSFLDPAQIVKVCEIHLPIKWQVKEVYEALTNKINGKKANITGAFIANLADNIKEMSEDDPEWTVDDTVSLIKESYKGFYSSQVEKEKETMGFKN